MRETANKQYQESEPRRVDIDDAQPQPINILHNLNLSILSVVDETFCEPGISHVSRTSEEQMKTTNILKADLFLARTVF